MEIKLPAWVTAPKNNVLRWTNAQLVQNAAIEKFAPQHPCWSKPEYEAALEKAENLFREVVEYEGVIEAFGSKKAFYEALVATTTRWPRMVQRGRQAQHDTWKTDYTYDD
jgi:hypothetical protein